MSKFDHLIEEGYSFDMGYFFSEGWELFKKSAGSFIGFTIVAFILVFLSNIMLSVISMATIGNIGLYVFSSLVVNILQTALQTTIFGGFYLFCRGLVTNRDDFGQFFSGFNQIGQVFLYTLVIVLITYTIGLLCFSLVLPWEMLPEIIGGGFTDMQGLFENISYSIEDKVGLFALVALVAFGGIVYISISYSMAIPLILDENMKFWDAMETSRKVVAKKFGSFFGTFIVLGLLIILGAGVTCGLGLLVLIPFSYCMLFTIYDTVLDPKKDNSVEAQIDQFGQKDEDINTESEDR